MQPLPDINAYFLALWIRFAQYVPQMISAVLVLLLGWLAAEIAAVVVRRAVAFTGADAWVGRTGLNEQLKLAPHSRYALVSNLMGSIAKWAILLGAVGVAADILGLPGVRAFVGTIIAYIPNVVVAVLILAIGMVAAQLLSASVAAGLGAAHMPGANRAVLAGIAKYAVIVFAVMAALTQLNIVPALIQIAFAGLVFALSLAFGLGGREHASQWIAKMKSSS